jgi:uroporphyrin-III C-methyltransferase
MLFGRAHEEIQFLKENHIKVEIVPGITAALGAAAELQVSLTRRGTARSVALVTPRANEGEAGSAWLAADTVVVYMGTGEAEAIAAALIAAGKPARTPVATVENASLPEMRVA